MYVLSLIINTVISGRYGIILVQKYQNFEGLQIKTNSLFLKILHILSIK